MQTCQDQAEKGGLFSLEKLPSQMASTLGAQDNLPGKTTKPREFRRGCAVGTAARGRSEAADEKEQAVGIEERMLMTSLHGNAVGGMGNGKVTPFAEEISLEGRPFFFFFFLSCLLIEDRVDGLFFLFFNLAHGPRPFDGKKGRD